MGSEWSETTLGQLTKDGGGFIQTGPFGSQLHASDYVDEGIPVIMPVNMVDNRVSLNDIARITEADAQRLSKHLVQEGDIVYSRRGDVTRKALITSGEVGMFCGTGCLLVRPGNQVDPQFLKYHLSTPENQEWIIRHAIGATMPNLNTGILGDIPLRIPSKKIQKKIAEILGTFDNKISLNRQINTTLESVAQVLFKSWFVDFDPVIDNALAAGNEIPDALQKRAAARAARREALRQQSNKTTEATDADSPEQALPDTGLSDQRLPTEIQQLFPDRFVFTEEMGWVPEGWELRSIGDMFYLLGGHPFKSSEYVDDGEYGVVTIKNVQDSKFIESCSNFMTKIPAKMKRHCFLERGDVLLSLTGNVGRVCLVSPGKYLLNQRVAKLVGKDGLSNAFAYFFFKQSRIFEAMLTIAKGTAQQNLSPIETAKLTQLLPDSSVIRECQKYFESEYLRLISCTAESQTLANLRDSLLPKLLSGQITIPDAEQQLAEVL